MPVPDATIDGVPDLAVFLKTLAEEGRAVVAPGALADESGDGLAVLRQYDELVRNDLALEAPKFSAYAALWGARLLYNLCRFTVCRDIGEAEVAAACTVSFMETRGPEADWSVDLTLRHLPKIFQLANHLSNADPLVQHIKNIAAAWPLSSVGIPGLGPLSLESLAGDAVLRRLYADRIVAAGDISRLGEARVDDLIRADLGGHHDLAPAFAAKLFPKNHDTH